MSHPLRDRNMINARLDAVSEILESMGSSNVSDGGDGVTISPKLHRLLTSVLTNLGRLPDIQRGITRIFHRTATASEVTTLLCILEVEVGWLGNLLGSKWVTSTMREN